MKGQPKFYGDGTLKGKYVCRYLDGQDRLQSVTVPTDWAEEKFGIKALALAQEFAYRAAAHQDYKDDKGKTYSLSWYVDVAEEKVSLMIDNFEINKLWYVPATRVLLGEKFKRNDWGQYIYDNKGSKIPRDQYYKELPERWYAFSTVYNQKREIDFEYLQENFSNRYLEKVKILETPTHFVMLIYLQDVVKIMGIFLKLWYKGTCWNTIKKKVTGHV